MVIHTNPCLSFGCLSLFIPPSLHSFPPSCCLVLFVPLLHPSTSAYPFLSPVIKKWGCSNRLQLKLLPAGSLSTCISVQLQDSTSSLDLERSHSTENWPWCRCLNCRTDHQSQLYVQELCLAYKAYALVFLLSHSLTRVQVLWGRDFWLPVLQHA